MQPQDESTRGDEAPERDINHRDVERIANPLSILHGYTELLQRRIRRGQAVDEEELLRVLDIIAESSRNVRQGLTMLLAKMRDDDVDPERQ